MVRQRQLTGFMTVFSAAGLFLGVLCHPGPLSAAGAGDQATDRTVRSYSVGYQVGSDFKQQEVDINPEIVLKGAMDALAEQEPLMTPLEMRNTMTSLQKKVSAARLEKRERAERENLEKGREFLAENGRREGVYTLPSGLQYEILRQGEGEPPGATDTVTVHYRGTLIDGTEFDSSYSRNEPASFALDKVIAGWTEALQIMRPGDKYRLFIPAGLAYGKRGAGKAVPPNSALIFEVELLAVVSGK